MSRSDKLEDLDQGELEEVDPEFDDELEECFKTFAEDRGKKGKEKR